MERKLKKLLEAVEKEVLRRPSIKTLDRLSLLAGFQDWTDFQKAWDGGDYHQNGDNSEEEAAKQAPQ